MNDPRRSAIPSSVRRPGLNQELEAAAPRFGFFQAVRLLRRLYPRAAPVGRDVRPNLEVVRFTNRVSLEFPASEIHELAAPRDPAQPLEMTTNFMGLIGPSGALPRHYTEYVQERIRKKKDFVLRDFLNLFHHRLVSLFYRAWEKYQAWIGFEQAEALRRQRSDDGPEAYRAFLTREKAETDRVAQVLLDLCGLGVPTARYRLLRDAPEAVPRRRVADESIVYYSGLFAQRHRSAIGLERMLQDFFRLPITVRQFQGQWLQLAPEDQSRFLPVGGNMQLGVDVVVGERVWDVQSKFRICIGPLAYDDFTKFLPAGSAYRPLIDLTRLYAGSHLDFDVQLILKRREVPRLQCSEHSLGGRLGWDCWTANEEFTQDVADSVFQVHDDERTSAGKSMSGRS